MSRNRLRAGLLLGGALLLAGCGNGSLEADDPAGYEACRIYAESLDEADPLMKMGALLDAGEQAKDANTEAINDATNEVGGSWLADSDALAEACEANGFN